MRKKDKRIVRRVGKVFNTEDSLEFDTVYTSLCMCIGEICLITAHHQDSFDANKSISTPIFVK